MKIAKQLIASETIYHPETRKIIIDKGTLINRQVILFALSCGVDNIPTILFITSH